jgi:transposase InsO family protein
MNCPHCTATSTKERAKKTKLAVMLDVFSRRIIGWAMSARCDELLVETALRMALARRQPGAGLLQVLST